MQFSMGEQLRGRTFTEAKSRFPDRTDKFLLFQMQRGRCFYCDRPMKMDGNEPTSCTRDHVIPQSSGHRASPFVAACRDCNMFRSSTPAHIFLLVMHAIIEAQGGVLTHHPMSRPLTGVRKRVIKFLEPFGHSGVDGAARR